MKRTTILTSIFLSLFFTGCNKLVEVNPPIAKFDATKVYLKDITAIAVLTGIYQQMSTEGIFQGTSSMSYLLGLSADELIDYSGGNSIQTFAFQNSITSNNVPFWEKLYSLIYVTNTALAGITDSSTLSDHVRSQLTGEAKFTRAFLYYYLTALWGDVPLVLTTDYKVNGQLTRMEKTGVYKQIINDLLDAERLLDDKFFLSDLTTETDERIRPTKWAAKAMLARMYLYTKNYSAAEALASQLIEREDLFHLEKLENVFLTTSRETIWQIQSSNPSWNTYDAVGFILNGAPNYFQPVAISSHLTNAFEPGDLRLERWIGQYDDGTSNYFYAFKYKVNTEFAPKTEALTVFRLSEQYLIRSEARSMQNKIPQAVDDINIIRDRSRGPATTTVHNPLPRVAYGISTDNLINRILHERQVELFTEWGHRWLDLKRLDRLNATMPEITLEKGGTWNDFKSLFPIPINDILYNKTLNRMLDTSKLYNYGVTYIFFMKHLLLMSGIFLIMTNTYGQGISFDRSPSWEQVLKKAQRENKYIFVDCYATWCGPCKSMDKEVFTVDSIGNFFNANYVSIKLQFDSTAKDDNYVRNWLPMAKIFQQSYQIEGFPTYLFFDPSGKLVSKTIGAEQAENFLANAKRMLNPSEQYFNLLERYNKGERGDALIRKLTLEASRLQDINVLRSVHEQFMKLSSPPYDREELIAISSGISGSQSPGFKLLMTNPDEYDEILGEEGRVAAIAKGYLSMEIYDLYIKDKGPNIPWKIITTYLDSRAPEFTRQIIMLAKINILYSQRKWEQFGKLKMDYYDLYAKKFDHNESFMINNDLMEVFRKCHSKRTLLRAANWTKFSLDHVYDPGYAPATDTYANLLYKAGSIKLALEWQNRALDMVSNLGKDEKAPYVENLEKMQHGLPTWKSADLRD